MPYCAPVWKMIPRYPMYDASSDGQIRSRRSEPPRLLVQYPHQGYLTVQLKVRPGDARLKCFVHRLVLLAFAGDPVGERTLCRHLDGNPRDNRADNLAWGTLAENVTDAINHGTAVCLRRGERHPASKLTDAQYATLRERLKRGERQAALAREYGLHPTYVGQIAKGRGRKPAPLPTAQPPTA